MPEDSQIDQDIGAPEALSTDPVPKGRRSLAKMRRELTDDELNSSGVQKIIMDDVDRLESEKSELQPYIEKFHDADKENAVLKQKIQTNLATEITFGILLTIGSAAIGYSPNLASIPTAENLVLYAGIVLIIAGIVSRAVVK